MSQTTLTPFEAHHSEQARRRQARCEQLENQITELAANIHAATCRLLELIREYDDSEGWAGPGLQSSATAPALLYLLHPCSRVPTG